MMNDILKTKLEELNSLARYECWYLVKQDTSFVSLCYLVDFLQSFQDSRIDENLENYIKSKSSELKRIKPEVKISSTHRALRVAACLGLIIMKSSSYNDATITPTFNQIRCLCNGEYEKTELYADIIQRQIEKMYVSSTLDEECEGVRKKYKLYPIMLLYKILLEQGTSTGEYSITIDEYRYLVTTTGSYESFLNTLLLIKIWRDHLDETKEFDHLRNKFDNRFIQVLKQLPTLNIDNNKIEIKHSKINEVRKKIFCFEQRENYLADNNYIEFLGSEESLFDDVTISENIDCHKRTDFVQEIHFGAPGTGKSYSLAGIISESYKGYKHTDENPYVFRTTIYSEYTYYDFIGNIMPSSDEDNKIEYKFSPGVFTQALTSAFKNEDKDIYLIIEEMSRGNIASILGDIFQLLDRDSTGKSEYYISNDIIYKELISKGVQNLPKGKIYLPSNFHILGTVNTSDQNVNVIDTAFKRRFDFVYEQVKPKQEKDQNGNWVYLNSYTFKLGEETFEWNQFYQKVNEFIVNENNGLGLSEDKQLGQFFVKFIQQSDNISNEEINNNNFKMVKNKILHYLWDDVQLASMTDNRIFNENLNSFADLYDIFDKQTSPKEIFSTEFLTFYNTAI
ncbi:AAA family ATPase [Streptococcus infantarius]|uniref:AAA family ATPase n=1 Tax=Streptococcus infantarius TaxID=102684 RepID=UPI0022E0AB7A|nr:AAA family ATPase [Streptococcus infantarius]